MGCLAGLHCVRGVCVPRLRQGALCDPTLVTGVCDREQGLSCDRDRRVCVRGAGRSACERFARDGAACRFAFKGLRDCVFPARCGGEMTDVCRLPGPSPETCP
ncbi:MAG: hypothetical protein HY909_26370 [Deltaproteobacteria bacterium]|nr:hypothetical protein [Deltaproteobacteria bacterium]